MDVDFKMVLMYLLYVSTLISIFIPNKLYHSSTDLRWEISQNFEIYEVPIKSVTKALNNRTDCFIAPYSE